VCYARAGRPYRAGYDTWDGDEQWGYDRGRLWAALAPKSIQLKRNGRVTREAMLVYERHHEDIL
jgi:hypothetical protein